MNLDRFYIHKYLRIVLILANRPLHAHEWGLCTWFRFVAKSSFVREKSVMSDWNQLYFKVKPIYAIIDLHMSTALHHNSVLRIWWHIFISFIQLWKHFHWNHWHLSEDDMINCDAFCWININERIPFMSLFAVNHSLSKANKYELIWHTFLSKWLMSHYWNIINQAKHVVEEGATDEESLLLFLDLKLNHHTSVKCHL